MPARSPLAPFLEPLDRLGFPYCKLEFLREGGQDKHIRDIRFILAATELDLKFVEAEVARLGLRVQWLQCRPD